MSFVFWPRECAEQTALSAASAEFIVRHTEEALESHDHKTAALNMLAYTGDLLRTECWLLYSSAQNVQALLQAHCLRSVSTALHRDVLENSGEVYWALCICYHLINTTQLEALPVADLGYFLASILYFI